MSDGGTVTVLLSGAGETTGAGVGIGAGWAGGEDEHPAEYTKKMSSRTHITHHFCISYSIVHRI